MVHWDMILILGGAVLGAFVYLVVALRRRRWGGAKLLLAAMVLGFASELIAFSLRPNGSTAWGVWLYIHLPASLALDPLDLSFGTWKWVTIGLYSVIATALWLFCFELVGDKSGLLKRK